ncbi:aminotransferase class III-fold pyridoxal phosphate-dependent enzyme [Bradyrhizobium sp. 169]|uniref:aminotransferase class III-fold pyridoxal phosphate-dependent enzyme n=1 Tax=Bradyrhizobium sp. 169 TaxID=2782640 RepID=UPI001FF834DA|nr:aminotransferase class III-fold pyridoxal phosphate-dependent enzyme [Bradyrhizobium sp. 169]
MSAIQEQAGKLNQVISAGYTHDPAEEVARLLLKLTPQGLDHVFYSDSGSASVEVALKMALGYWHNIGEERTRIIVAALLSRGHVRRDVSWCPRCLQRGVRTSPVRRDLNPVPCERRERATLDALESACRNENPAAFIVEPLMLGAGGILMYPAWVLREMKRICEAPDVLFIADEVMTGWGRTGTIFACEQANVVPDIACYSKGLTGGALPLAVTLCRAESFDAHYSKDRTRTFFHSSSYTANPVACAAAKANLDLWKGQECHRRIAAVATMQEQAIEGFRADPRFANVRRSGTITALDLKTRDTGYLAGVGPRLHAFLTTAISCCVHSVIRFM